MPAAEFYISSTKYSLQERMTRRGKVYDVVFRIVTLDGIEKQKKLSGFSSKTLAKQGYTDFVTSKCELVKNNPIKKKTRPSRTCSSGTLSGNTLPACQTRIKRVPFTASKKYLKNLYCPILKTQK